MKEGTAPEYIEVSSIMRRSLDGWVRALADVEGVDHRRYKKAPDMPSNGSLQCQLSLFISCVGSPRKYSSVHAGRRSSSYIS
jgi:hypothetical protein